MSQSLLSEIAPSFRPYLQYLFKDLKLGLCKAKVDMESMSNLSDEASSHFSLFLPYCSKKLKWEVLFDPSAPWFAPDFRFDDDNFLGNLDVNIIEENVPSLANWDGKDPKALTQVISELVTMYKKYQLNKLKEDENSRALFEYSALLGDVATNEWDIEVLVQDHQVEFLIKLNIDVSQLPEIYNEGIEENPSIDTALLLVRYPNTGSPELILSPSLIRIIGRITMPPMHPNGVLIDYVPTITKLINNKIKFILNNEKFKRYLLSEMVTKYNGALLEHADNNAAFLFEVNGFHWIIQIALEDFPEKAPTIILRSVYHQSRGKPKSKILPPCPYFTIPKFQTFLMQQFEIFKNECVGINIEN